MTRSTRRLRRATVPALLAASLLAGILSGPGTGLPDRLAPPAAAAPAQDESVSTPADDPADVVASPADANGAPTVDAAPNPAAGETVPAAAPVASADVTTTAYEEWQAHEHDRTAFAPGGRVTVGFTPRPDDTWSVGGTVPAALPAGSVTGSAMAAARQGTVWTAPSPGNGAQTAPSPSSGPPTGGATGSLVTPATAATYLVPATGASPAAAATTGLRRQVFGFLPYWELAGASASLNYAVLTTIAYFSVGVDAAGNLTKRNANGGVTTGWAGWTSSAMTSVINAAHAHGTRVVLTASVFAWTNTGAALQRAILSSAAARLNLARQLAAAVRDRGADGVNLDFEPLVAGQEAGYVAFVRTLRAQLNAIRPGYQLTFDTTGYIGNYPIETLLAPGAADAVFVMGYDYRTDSASTSGSVDPLTGPGYDLTDTAISYTSRVSPSRVILGVPWYGRAWSTASSAPRAANTSSARYGYSTAVNYQNIPALVAKYGRRWDPVEQSPYIAYQRQNCTATYGCVTSWRQVWYDDAASLALRYQLVNDYGLRGAGMWALGYDGAYRDLVGALSNAFLVDHAAPQAGITALPPTSPDEGIVVAWSATDVSGIRSYDVQAAVDGGAWTPWLTGTTETQDVWLGADGHAYAFRVRAVDSKGNTGAWNVTSTAAAAPASLAVGGFGRVTLDGLAIRSGPSTSAAKLGTLPAGTIVALTSGPVAANGSTWFEVTQPVRQWAPVSFVERGVWIAVRSATGANVVPVGAPNATVVDAGIAGFNFASGGATGGTPAAVAARTLSPNGDGARDGLVVRWTATVPLTALTLNVVRLDGSLVGSVAVPVRTAGAHTWTWDGTVGGKRVPDGRYLLQLAGSAGARQFRAPSALPATPGQIAAYAVTVDTVPPVINAATASTALISPNGDRIRDAAPFTLSSTGAASWFLRVAAGTAAPLRTLTGAGGTIKAAWDGRSDAGAVVADGDYTVTLGVCDVAGNCSTRAFPVRVDDTAPSLGLTASPSVFSPNADGTSDTAVLGWTSSEPAGGTATMWRGTTLVRRWPVAAGTAGSLTWDGRTSSGAPAADGRYTFRVDVRDAAGNRAVASLRVVVDRTAAALRWSGSFCPQDGDALARTATASWRLVRSATTSLALYDAAGSLVRTVWTNRPQSAGTRTWTWDGRLADGTYAPQGLYVAQLTVASPYSTQVLTRSVWAAAFAGSLSATTVKAGGTLTVSFRSVEALRSAPQATFAQPGRAPVTVTAARVADGSYRATFSVRQGPSGPATVEVSGTDVGGHANAMTYPLAVGP